MTSSASPQEESDSGASESNLSDGSGLDSEVENYSSDPFGSEDLKGELLDCLDDVNGAGSFCTYSQTDIFVNPGLYIEGYGLIPLPLSSRDADGIAQCSKQAPFGKGDETVVDTSVRKTWELSNLEFQCQNPSWESYVRTLVKDAANGLGVEGPVCPESYKLLLYEEGAFFKPHKDTEKVPGMFGTLVVCLPSKHEGGDVHLSHAGKEKVLKTAPKSEFDLSTLAWYSDVTHEIKPLMSGYRLVLTYNLVQKAPGTVAQSAKSLDDRRMQLQRLLLKWRKDFSYHEKFIYILEHQYTESSLSLQNLKGRDRPLGQHLYDVCYSNGFYFFLANMRRQVCEEEGEEESEEEDYTTLDYIVTPSGLSLPSSINLEIGEILQQIPFDRDADSVEEGEFTGNESAPATLRYHDTVAILVPGERLSHVFLNAVSISSEPITNLVDFVCLHAQTYPNDNILKECAVNVMKQALRERVSYSYRFNSFPHGQILAAIVKWSLKFQDSDLFREAVESGLSGPGSFAHEILDVIAKRVNENCFNGSPNWSQWLDIIASKSKSLSDLQNSFSQVEYRLAGEHLQRSFKSWAVRKLDERLELQEIFRLEDLPALFQILESRDHDWVINKFLPILSGRGTRDLLVSFLNKLYEKRVGKYFEKILVDMFRYILKNNTSVMALTAGDLKSITTPGPYASENILSSYPGEFVTLVDATLDLGLSDEATHVFEITSVGISGSQDLISLHWVGTTQFIRSLTLVLQKHGSCVPTPPIKILVEKLLEALVGAVTRQYPQRPEDWARKPRGCGCPDCVLLDKFLIHPFQSVYRFAMAERRRTHLEYRLDRRYYKMETERTRSPYTLVVTKTGREYQEQLAQWTSEFQKLEAEFRLLQGGEMEALLGDKYRDLILLEKMRDFSAQSSFTLANSQPRIWPLGMPQPWNVHTAPQPVAGVKRKQPLGIIDLTGDSL